MRAGDRDPSERRQGAAGRRRCGSSRLAARGHERAREGRRMSMAAEERSARAPWALTAPALMLFVGVLLIPLAMTVMLSFHDWGQYKGIEPVFILKNWHEIATDPYYAEMFWRTFRIAILTTLLTALLGAPEAY